MGRPRISLPVEEVIRLYKKYKSIVLVAEEFGVHPQTISARLVENGIKLDASKHATKAMRHRGGLVKWIRANPDVKLPRKPSEIAELTGLSIDQVKSYLYRRRKIADSMVGDLPDLSEVPLVLRDFETKEYVPTRSLVNIQVESDWPTMEYVVNGQDKNGKKYEFRIPITALRKKLLEVEVL
jgi:hypothetical protein